MTPNRVERILVLALTLGLVPPAWALVLGGGPPRKSDCYVAWDGVTASRGVAVSCKDGDPSCDVDSKKDGKCTFGVDICVGQTDPAGKCTPQPVTAITPPSRIRPCEAAPGAFGCNITATSPTPIVLDLPDGGPPWSGSPCGAFTPIEVFLRHNRRGAELPSKPVKLRMVATSDARPKRDADKLGLRCLPGPESCPANPDGGPDQVTITVKEGGRGADLDNGVTGQSFNFLVTGSSQLTMCLTGCDGSTNPVCQAEGKTGPNSINGPVYGAPLPLFASNTPVCVVNRFRDPPGEVVGTANLETGEGTGTVRLSSEVFLTVADERLCPQCSGGGLGESGTCQFGPNVGKACVVDGTVDVVLPTGPPRTFMLSKSCPPPGSPIARLPIDLDLTTGTIHKDNPIRDNPACQAQDQPNGCGGPCATHCSSGTDACFSMVDDPTNPGGPQVCADKKGGLSQLCCANGQTPCHPSTAEGGIVRHGLAAPVSPAWNTPDYPKSSDTVFASVFCEPQTNSVIDITTGLPGPGALILPVTQTFTKAP